MEAYNTFMMLQKHRFDGLLTGRLMFPWKSGLLPALSRLHVQPRFVSSPLELSQPAEKQK